MKVNGSHTFQAPRDVVWPMLQDPNVLSKVMPGCEELTATGENEYEGILKIKVGPVQGKFKGTVSISNINEPESYDITVNGRGPAGIIKGTGSLNLAETDDATTMTYDGDAEVRGRIASVGQRLIDTSARAIIRQSLEALDNQVTARLQPAATATSNGDGTKDTTAVSSPPVAAPTQSEFAAGVAKNFIDELIPAEEQGEVFTKAALIIGALLLTRLLLNWWTKRLAHRIATIVKNDLQQ